MNCPVLTDLQQQRIELKRGFSQIKRDLKFCAHCDDKCKEFVAIKSEIEQAISEALAEIQSCQTK